jgi:transcriptional regulator MraZ
VVSASSMHPTVQRFQNWVNFYGALGSLDAQGRVVIPPLLRKSAEVTGNVAVLGKLRFLDVWNQEKFLAKLEAEPLTDEDDRVLASVLQI